MEFNKKLSEEIRKGNVKSLYVFHGEEKTGIQSSINKLTKGEYIEGYSFKEVKPYLMSNNFFIGDFRWVVIKEAKDVLDVPYKELKSMSKNVGIILIFDKIDKRKKFFKDAKKDLYEFQLLKEAALVEYIQEQLSINRDKALYVIQSCNNDLSMISMEIFKLKHVNKITDRAFKDLIITNPQDKIFDYIDSIMAGDAVKSFKLYNDLIELKESPIKMLSILYLSCRTQFIINSMRNRSNKEIANKTDLSYWQVKMSRDKKCKFNNEDLEFIMNRIQEVETDIKTGKQDTYIGYEKLMVDLLRR